MMRGQEHDQCTVSCALSVTRPELGPRLRSSRPPPTPTHAAHRQPGLTLCCALSCVLMLLQKCPARCELLRARQQDSTAGNCQPPHNSGRVRGCCTSKASLHGGQAHSRGGCLSRRAGKARGISRVRPVAAALTQLECDMPRVSAYSRGSVQQTRPAQHLQSGLTKQGQFNPLTLTRYCKMSVTSWSMSRQQRYGYPREKHHKNTSGWPGGNGVLGKSPHQPEQPRRAAIARGEQECRAGRSKQNATGHPLPPHHIAHGLAPPQSSPPLSIADTASRAACS